MFKPSNESFLLEHFLCMDTTNPESWVAALQVITTSPSLTQEIPSNVLKDFRARLSSFSTKDLRVLGAYIETSSNISGFNAGSTTIVVPVKGKIEFKVNDGVFFCNTWSPFILNPHDSFQARLSSKIHIFIIQLHHKRTLCNRRVAPDHNIALTEVISEFIHESPFYQDFEDATLNLSKLSSAIYELFDNDFFYDKSQIRKTNHFHEDRRICKAIEHINDKLHTEIDIDSIAASTGMSLRNFHILMKKNIKQTPYQYISNRRLIKIKEEIIQGYPEKVTASKRAHYWGFHHAGRFSNYYYKYFGEYPKETLRALERLDKLTFSITRQEKTGFSVNSLSIPSKKNQDV